MEEIKVFATQPITLLELPLEVVRNWKHGDSKIEAPVLTTTSIVEGDGKHLYPADESLFVSDLQSFVIYSMPFGSKTICP